MALVRFRGTPSHLLQGTILECQSKGKRTLIAGLPPAHLEITHDLIGGQADPHGWRDQGRALIAKTVTIGTQRHILVCPQLVWLNDVTGKRKMKAQHNDHGYGLRTVVAEFVSATNLPETLWEYGAKCPDDDYRAN
jgi:hypothetical protein